MSVTSLTLSFLTGKMSLSAAVRMKENPVWKVLWDVLGAGPHRTWSLRMVLHRCDWVTRQLHLKGGRTRTDQNGASTLPASKGEA